MTLGKLFTHTHTHVPLFTKQYKLVLVLAKAGS